LLLPDADAELDADLALMTEVAREAGKLSLEWLEKGARSWDKSPGNVVTEADIAVNDLISKRLRHARPGYGWLSEETKDNAADRTQSRVWVIDPIDGTKDFVKGEPGFCVSIACIEGSQPTVGVVYNPVLDELLAARLGGGATMNGKTIRVTACGDLSCRMVGQPDVFVRGEAARYWPGIEILTPIPNSIAWRMCLVASGRWDAAVALNSKSDWDLAAAVLLISEAGGVTTDRFGQSFAFNRPSVIQNGVVAAGAGLHPLIMERVQVLLQDYQRGRSQQ
jgi:myo-inositol-1(or 4)-monophosphatase